MFVNSLQKLIWLCINIFVLQICLSVHNVCLTTAEEDEHYLNQWAVEIPGGSEIAREVADEYGFKVVRELRSSIPDHYLFERNDIPQRRRRSSTRHTHTLTEDNRVIYAEQQQLMTRVKRDITSRQVALEALTTTGTLDDPEFLHQWYFDPTVSKSRSSDTPLTDLRVKDVWKKGITGKNIVISIIDDGLEINHPDIKENYDPLASGDLIDHDDDPTPLYDPTDENKHGTRCAGVVSMSANNNICGAGIAFNSKIGGIRFLGAAITDNIEAMSLGLKFHHIDIYSSSWGPSDNGKACDGPRKLGRKALKTGVTEGRGGKGSLFVWASGNGGRSNDNCNTDGFNTAIETISVSSSSQHGQMPFYAEKCASSLTTSYSSGSRYEGQVVTTDIHQKCTKQHTGTSAAAPMVAGIIALLLEINPNVTWRDVQHIIVHSSKMEPLSSASVGGWYRNGAGYCVNTAFGFGLLDALTTVETGDLKTWKNVEQQRICIIEPTFKTHFPIKFVSGQSLEISFQTSACAGQENEINYLEHVQVILDLEHGRRGNIYVEMVSAMGTVTPLMYERINDDSKSGFQQWPLMSTHSWGENPKGKWIIRIADRSNNSFQGKLKGLSIVLYGTKNIPEYRKIWPISCGVLSNLTNSGSVAPSTNIHLETIYDHQLFTRN